MAELKEKPLKILSALSQMTEPVRPSDIANITGERPVDVGRNFGELLKGGLAEKVDEEQNLWAITDNGRDYLDSVAECHRPLAVRSLQVNWGKVRCSKEG